MRGFPEKKVLFFEQSPIPPPSRPRCFNMLCTCAGTIGVVCSRIYACCDLNSLPFTALFAYWTCNSTASNLHAPQLRDFSSQRQSSSHSSSHSSKAKRAATANEPARLDFERTCHKSDEQLTIGLFLFPRSRPLTHTVRKGGEGGRGASFARNHNFENQDQNDRTTMLFYTGYTEITSPRHWIHC